MKAALEVPRCHPWDTTIPGTIEAPGPSGPACHLLAAGAEAGSLVEKDYFLRGYLHSPHGPASGANCTEWASPSKGTTKDRAAGKSQTGNACLASAPFSPHCRH